MNERKDEEFSRLYVGAIMQAEITQHDTGSLQGAHDYDIHLDDEVAALEVVRCADSSFRSTQAAATRYCSDPLIDRALRGEWEINVSSDAQVKGLLPKVVSYLKEMEEQGFSRWDNNDAAVGSGESSYGSWFASHGVMSARSFASDESPGTVRLVVRRSSWMALDPEESLLALERYIFSPAMEDVPPKLLRSGRSKRHLLLWLDAFSPIDGWWCAGRGFEQLPNRAANLPDGITHLWAVGPAGGWIWAASEGWAALPAPYKVLLPLLDPRAREGHARRRDSH